VPGWAWVNSLAHGTAEDLAAVANDKATGGEPGEVMAGVARQVIGVMERTGLSLSSLGRSTLIQLASRLPDLCGCRCPRDRSQLAECVGAALGQRAARRFGRAAVAVPSRPR
jgi:hypothetical protein